MSDELRAAAERLRAIKAGAPNPGYGHPYQYQHFSGGWYVDRAKIVVDQLLIVDAYLAEHPADDGDAVTVEWLESVGFKSDDDEPYLWINGGWEQPPEFDLEKWEDGDWIACDGDNTLKLVAPKTRSDVRRLCAALGITLAEGEG